MQHNSNFSTHPKTTLADLSNAEIFSLKQVLYNGILLFLRSKFEGRAKLLGATEKGAFYSIFTGNNQKYYNIEEVKEYLKQISSCELLYPYEDPKGAVGDQDPTLVNNVLFYQPLRYKFEITNLSDLLSQVSQNLVSVRRSNTLKFYFED